MTLRRASVAPRGKMKLVISLLAPILRVQSIFMGSAPTELAEEKANRNAGAIPRKNAIGLIFPRTLTIPE